MTKSEKEVLTSICQDIEDSEDKIDALERLYSEVKLMIGYKYRNTEVYTNLLSQGDYGI